MCASPNQARSNILENSEKGLEVGVQRLERSMLAQGLCKSLAYRNEGRRLVLDLVWRKGIDAVDLRAEHDLQLLANCLVNSAINVCGSGAIIDDANLIFATLP